MSVLIFILILSLFSGSRAFHVPRFNYRRQTIRSISSMSFDWKESKLTIEGKMSKSLESLQSQMNTLRVGAANPSILDRIMVDHFGAPTPLKQIARIGTSGASTIIIEPFDKTAMKDIEKSILTSNLDLTPNSDGTVIRINLPPLTEERRKNLVKQAHVMSESGKVSIRNIRRELHDKIKLAEKNKEIGKDDSKDFQVSLY